MNNFELEIYGLEGLYRFGWWDHFRCVKFGIFEDKFNVWNGIEYNER